jgi:NAD+ synthase (glutamine-hydrolysing)
MKVAMAQMSVHAGQIETNLATMHRHIQEATAAGADLIVFPEMCVGGYVLGDRLLQSGFQDALLAANQTIASWSKDLVIVWGNLHHFPDGALQRDGRRNRLNAAFMAQHGRLIEEDHGLGGGVYVKHCLPDYRVFDDSRYYKSGVDLALEQHQAADAYLTPFTLQIQKKTWRIGLQVCEDLWSESYAIQPTDVVLKKGVDLIINVSSSPYTLDKERSREKRLQRQAQRHGDAMVPLIYVNACGLQNNGKNIILFDGDSTYYNAQGQAQVQANGAFEEELCIFDLSEVRLQAPPTSKVHTAIVAGLRAFDAQFFKAKPPWIIGLSGGLDSSINACLLVEALSPQRVISYNLASKYNQPTTIQMAAELARRLGIEHHHESIEPLLESSQERVSAFGIEHVDGLALENMQARLRGHLLSSFAASKGGVILNNGNKVELALGYATLYGDTIGALSPLGDLTKVQLFDLAKSINAKQERPLIDERLIPYQVQDRYVFEVAPSAELKAQQVDPMKWGYHDLLVSYLTEYPTHHPLEFLRLYASGDWRSTAFAPWILAYGLDDPNAFAEDYHWFTRAWHLGVFKRIQFPPIFLLSRGAFGYDYRESQLVHQFLPEERALLADLQQRKGNDR